MDLSKHISLFDPNKLTGSVGIIGAGATGSILATLITKLGVNRLNIYDDDIIELHNISNQTPYCEKHIGQGKAVTIANICKDYSDGDIQAFPHKITGKNKIFDKTVFMCTDSMSSRIEIFRKCLYLRGTTDTLIDMRINAFAIEVYIIDLYNLDHCAYYEQFLYSDEDIAQVYGNCGLVMSIGATAGLAACIATELFIYWSMNLSKKVFKINMDVKEWSFSKTTFKQMED